MQGWFFRGASSRCSIRSCKATRHKWLICIAVLLLAGPYMQLVPFVSGACQAPKGALSKFIDPSTPVEACKKRMCVGPYKECCGSDPNSCDASAASTTDMVLVFSDEFEDYGKGVLGSPQDIRWTSMDYHYSSDLNEWQNYKPENVNVQDGKLLLTLEDRPSSAIRHGETQSDRINANKTSGMVQGWNKFCFTGGFAEFSVRLPGDPQHSGFWAAAWLMGNLGRAGHYPSLAGMWPFSYDKCASGSEAFSWNNYKTQRISACKKSTQGRGAPEIDVLEYGAFPVNGQAKPQYVHTMQMGPVAPPYTSWMLPDKDGNVPGIRLPGKSDRSFGTYLGTSYGPLTRADADMPIKYFRTGSALTDTYTGSSYLGGKSWFENHHKYSVLWEPGEFVRWYLDDEILFEVDKEALRKQSSQNLTDNDLTVEERMIPFEPSYVVMNLAMSNNAWAKVNDSLKYPGVMSVDWVRIWQHPDKINVGCDPPGFPTTQYISCNRHLYLADNERGMWKFPWCKEVSSGENRFLLGLGSSVAIVLLIVAFLLALMSRAFKKEQELQQKANRDLPAGITRDRTPESKIKGCYINKGGRDLQELLEHTRPGLLAVAKAQQIATSKAQQTKS